MKLSKLIPSILIFTQLIQSPTNIVLATENDSHNTEYQAINPETDKKGVFNEIEVDPTDYPASSLPNDMPEDLTIENLREAMITYFEKSYSDEEKKADLEPLSTDKLTELNKAFQESNQFKDIKVHIDQVAILLEGKKHYITRAIVDGKKEDIDQILANNDIAIMNELLAIVGNRLVMVCYYDKSDNKLIPYHLTNRTKSLFTLDKEREHLQENGMTESSNASHLPQDDTIKNESNNESKQEDSDEDSEENTKSEEISEAVTEEASNED